MLQSKLRLKHSYSPCAKSYDTSLVTFLRVRS